MRKLLPLVIVAAVAALVFFAPSRADAGPVWQTTLSSNDAGSTQTVTITAKTCYCVQASKNETCIKLTTGSGAAADCTKDFLLPSASTELLLPKAYCFDSAAKTSLVARMRDGGTVDANLFKLEQSPSNGALDCSTGAFGL